jgi:excisionase family DNA binding protein
MALLTVKAAAARLGCSPALIYLLCTERRLAHVRLGTRRGTIRIAEEDLDAFVQGCKVNANALPEGLKHIRMNPTRRPQAGV